MRSQAGHPYNVLIIPIHAEAGPWSGHGTPAFLPGPPRTTTQGPGQCARVGTGTACFL